MMTTPTLKEDKEKEEDNMMTMMMKIIKEDKDKMFNVPINDLNFKNI